MTWLEKLNAWAEDFEKEIAALVEQLDGRVHRLQGALWAMVVGMVAVRFSADSGDQLRNTAGNLAKAAQLEGVFDAFYLDIVLPELRDFAAELVAVSGRTLDYYRALGIDDEKLAAIEKSLGFVRTVIGIEPDGSLAANGFLNRLGRSEEVRQLLKNYVLQSVATRKPLADFVGGFKAIVLGRDDVDGALQSYWRQYAYDSYNQVREISAMHAADELKLDDFVYQGSVIDTTRPFCRKRAGKVFSREEAAKWKNDPDLIDKKTAAAYNPFIERGRYNCRHFLMWITPEQAAEWRKTHNQ